MSLLYSCEHLPYFVLGGLGLDVRLSLSALKLGLSLSEGRPNGRKTTKAPYGASQTVRQVSDKDLRLSNFPPGSNKFILNLIIFKE